MSNFIQPKKEIKLRPVNETDVETLSKDLGVSQTISRILVARNLNTYDECKNFFRPSLDAFCDPFLFKDMRKAVSRITKALLSKENIAIYGDYDVDGITATALLFSVLNDMGANVEYYLPNRLTEGYGLSNDGIDTLNSHNVKLIITVDCGITSTNAVNYANELGIDIIITDHHVPSKELPMAYAVIDHKVKDCQYPDKNLAGVGVALKLSQALTQETNSDNNIWLKNMDIVALGTAADIVPLIGENRIINYFGYQAIYNTKRIGLVALMSLQGILGQSLTTSDIVFKLTPCINAVGRLGESKKGIELLLTKNSSKAEIYAKELYTANTERRELDKVVFEEAKIIIEKSITPKEDYAFVVADKNWHVGVIGIAASRIAEYFFRPVFLFSIEENGIARGSGRSIPGVHLLDALEQCSDLLENFGGHAVAAGASIKQENILEFSKRFNNAVKQQISENDLIPKVIADAEVTIPALTPRFYNTIKRMAPFGPGNKRPVFIAKNLKNHYPPRIVGKKHLKLSIQGDGQIMDAIAFNMENYINDIATAHSFSLAFTLEENEWNGKTSLQMNVKGVDL